MNMILRAYNDVVLVALERPRHSCVPDTQGLELYHLMKVAI